jgi:hypothetical protein
MKTLFSLLLLAIFCCIGDTAFAAPASCMLPNTHARVRKVGSTYYCAANVCRTIGKQTQRTTACSGVADCAAYPMGHLETYEVVGNGAWASLPACPTWTNTSTWY